MAVVKIPKESSLKLKFSCGLDKNGKEVTKSKSLAHLKNTASDDDVHAIGKAVASLCMHTLVEVARVDNSVISK